MHPVTGIERIGRNCRRDFTAIVADPGACRNQGPAKIARTVLTSGHQPGSLNTGSRTDSSRKIVKTHHGFVTKEFWGAPVINKNSIYRLLSKWANKEIGSL